MIEKDNEERVEKLASKVSRLKQVTNDLEQEASSQNRLIDEKLPYSFERMKFGMSHAIQEFFMTSEYPPLTKNFYKQHEDTARRPWVDVKAFFREYNITIEGKGSRYIKPVFEFHETNFPDAILKLFENKEFENPSPIQSVAWPILLSGRDMIGIASTGSGKTLSFLIPLLIHISHQPPLLPDDGPLGVVLVPTRELANQILGVAEPYCEAMNYRLIKLVGGESRDEQMRLIGSGAHIYVCTPGRLLDFLDERITTLFRVSFIVLDEADKMLDMGFEVQVRKILSSIREDKQMSMFSATWPRGVRKLSDDFLCDSIYVAIGSSTRDFSLNHSIKQVVIVCDENDKQKELLRIMNEVIAQPEHKTIIFCRTKLRVGKFVSLLYSSGNFQNILSLHGGKSQEVRNEVFKLFKQRSNAILMATDVASRGLDVDDVKFVVNVDYPHADEVYIHRIGRTGRLQGCQGGTAYTLFTIEDKKHSAELAAMLSESNQEVPPQLAAWAKAFGRSHLRVSSKESCSSMPPRGRSSSKSHIPSLMSINVCNNRRAVAAAAANNSRRRRDRNRSPPLMSSSSRSGRSRSPLRRYPFAQSHDYNHGLDKDDDDPENPSKNPSDAIANIITNMLQQPPPASNAQENYQNEDAVQMQYAELARQYAQQQQQQQQQSSQHSLNYQPAVNDQWLGFPNQLYTNPWQAFMQNPYNNMAGFPPGNEFK